MSPDIAKSSPEAKLPQPRITALLCHVLICYYLDVMDLLGDGGVDPELGEQKGGMLEGVERS